MTPPPNQDLQSELAALAADPALSRFVAAGTARFAVFAGAFAPEPLFLLPLFIIVSVS